MNDDESIVKLGALVGEISESDCSGNIISANFESDLFTDSEELFKLSNLENLILMCHRVN